MTVMSSKQLRVGLIIIDLMSARSFTTLHIMVVHAVTHVDYSQGVKMEMNLEHLNLTNSLPAVVTLLQPFAVSLRNISFTWVLHSTWGVLCYYMDFVL